MGGPDHLDPLRGADAPRGNAVPQLVVQNLGRGPRQAADPGLAQREQVVADRPPGPHRAVQDLFGGEPVDVDVREELLDPPGQPDVEVALHFGGEAGLDAHLGRAEVPRFLRAPQDLFLGEKIALLLAEVAAERAEAAPLDADVGKVDVAVHDVGDGVPHRLTPQMVGRGQRRVEIGARDTEQALRLVGGDVVARQRLVEDPRHVGGHLGEQPGERERRVRRRCHGGSLL